MKVKDMMESGSLKDMRLCLVSFLLNTFYPTGNNQSIDYFTEASCWVKNI